MTTDTERTEVLIAGAGMAGLVAAARAQEEGADVILVEKGRRPGGSMFVSNGYILTYETPEKIHEAIPRGNSKLQRLLVERLEPNLDWIERIISSEALLDEELPRSSMQGRKIAPEIFTAEMVRTIEERGGKLHPETPLEQLIVEETGAIGGGVCRRPDMGQLRIEADAVILATGGFPGNEELIERHIAPSANDIWLRANPWSTGDGLLAAQEAGAKTTGGWGRFYGHNLPAPPAEFKPAEFADVTQYYGPHAVALNAEGERFTDESESELEETLTQDTAARADCRAYYVLDEDFYESKILGERAGDMFERAAEAGGRVATVDSFMALGDVLNSWGVDGDCAIQTIKEFNEAIRSDDAGSLHLPRETNRHTVDVPPYRVVEVQPGITMTVGGLDVTDEMAVIRRASSSSGMKMYPDDVKDLRVEPIPRLYAAGADIGNIQHRHYAGGLAIALVTGTIAGDCAAGSTG